MRSGLSVSMHYESFSLNTRPDRRSRSTSRSAGGSCGKVKHFVGIGRRVVFVIETTKKSKADQRQRPGQQRFPTSGAQSPFSCRRGDCGFEVLSYVGRQRGFAKCLYNQCDHVQSRPLGYNVRSVQLDTMYYSLITTPIFSDSRLRIGSRTACFRHKDLCRTFAIANGRS